MTCSHSMTFCAALDRCESTIAWRAKMRYGSMARAPPRRRMELRLQVPSGRLFQSPAGLERPRTFRGELSDLPRSGHFLAVNDRDLGGIFELLHCEKGTHVAKTRVADQFLVDAIIVGDIGTDDFQHVVDLTA